MTDQTFQLKQSSSKYKMVIPAEVEDKIRFTCQQIYNIEWSGILFYTIEGSFKDNLVVHCKDFYIMDIGNSVFTSFEMNAEVIGYMCENELMDCHIGSIHSHHSMQSFFSGTDTDTLLKEGSCCNNFVSLIVNNAGTYNAAVTRQVISSKKIIDTYTYTEFSETLQESSDEYMQEEKIVEYFYLDIEKESTDSESLRERIEFLKNAKKEKEVKEVPKTVPMYFKENTQYSLFDDEEVKPVTVSQHSVDKVVCQILTCSLMVEDPNKIDLNKWVSSMEEIYAKKFTNFKEFEDWADIMVDNIILINVSALNLPDSKTNEGARELCTKVIEKLKSFKSNKYINRYIENVTESKNFYIF